VADSLEQLLLTRQIDLVFRQSVAASEFHVAIAKTVEEASRLIATGFEFMYEHQGVMIYRKRK
jgi:hypothetical protein